MRTRLAQSGRAVLACLGLSLLLGAQATAPNGEPEVQGACSGANEVCMIQVGVTVPNPWSYVLAQNSNTQVPTFSAAVQASFLVWGTQAGGTSDGVANASVPCSSLVTTQTGLDTNPTAAYSGDGKNSIGVNVTDNTGMQYCYLNAGACQGGTGSGTSAVGLAVEEFSSAGDISECDVYYNSVDYQFDDYVANLNPGANTTDIETVANQEVGHCFGLNHYLTDQAAVMYPYVAAGQTRLSLQPHDINNVCALFPVSGAFGGACNNGTCNNGSACVNDGTTSYCSNTCTPGNAASCPTGYHCAAVPANGSPAGQNYCLAGTSTAGVPIGIPCNSSVACNPSGSSAGQCIPGTFTDDGGTHSTPFPDGYCVASCTPLGDGGPSQSTCPQGDLCLQNGGGQTGGFCVKGCPGFFPAQSACGRTDGYACQPLSSSPTANGTSYSNFACLFTCQTTADCANYPAGYVCRTADNSCVPGGGSTNANAGDPCTADSQCPLGGQCLTAAMNWPGGYCVVSDCGPNPSGICGASGDCVVIDSQSNYGACYGACNLSTGSGCRSGYVCQSDGAQPAGGICLPGQVSTGTGAASTGGAGTTTTATNGGSVSSTGSGSGGNGTGSGSGPSTSTGLNGSGGNGVNGNGANGGFIGGGNSGAAGTTTTGGSSGGGCTTGGGTAPWLLALAALALRRRRS